MFRNPRENLNKVSEEQLLPSTGRPPTPPHASRNGASTTAQSLGNMLPAHASKLAGPSPPMPILGPIRMAKLVPPKKNAGKQNQSILSFFGKANRNDVPQVPTSQSLFLDETSPLKNNAVSRTPEGTARYSSPGDEEDDLPRYNEINTPSKRIKLLDISNQEVCAPAVPKPCEMSTRATSNTNECSSSGRVRRRGGFIDDLDNEEHDDNTVFQPEETPDEPNVQSTHEIDLSPSGAAPLKECEQTFVEVVESTKVPLKPADDSEDYQTFKHEQLDNDAVLPGLSRQSTNIWNLDEFGTEDFEDEFFPEGEEFVERKFMEEQLALERDFNDDSKSESGTDGARTPRTPQESNEVEDVQETAMLCPMCNGALRNLSETEASAHVNACLDGTAQPLPKPGQVKLETKSTESPSRTGSKKFQRAAIARPAQANPLVIMNSKGGNKSAFNQLMSGHAEDAAWAEAAHNEHQSRGKPAYQRTCPFYKIMPNLNICVDAFRYGKVEGQHAYFLSHFHSDHYIGLTSTWSHGPIYASKISCNLMRQQLRVNPKFLFPLEFEQRTPVPNTPGVFVTMIPANHCPGSSLFLFERQIGQNKDGSPKLHRILHCGDFRACPAHIAHPLLRPEVADAVSGATKQQSIDICYLDTTYLTPKYAFPGQYDVIDACAQMCISLSKEIVDNNDSWEKTKLERTPSTMKKFLASGADTGTLEQVEQAEAELFDVKPAMRGRLLVVVGTYSIGKERICMGIARALKSKIFAPPQKMRICKALQDDELNSFLTSNPLEAQVHMQMLMEIRAETLYDYMAGFKPHFSRVVGFRPTGWSYKPPGTRSTDNPSVQTVLYSNGWKSNFTMKDLVPQRGSTRDANCFGVPYSEHSSFRELTMFCCALRIHRIIPTVNVGSARSREKMKGWIEKWEAEKKKNGLFKVEAGAEGWGSGDGMLRYGV